MKTSDKGPAPLGKAAVAATGDDESDAGGIMIDVAAGGSFTIKATASGVDQGARSERAAANLEAAGTESSDKGAA